MLYIVSNSSFLKAKFSALLLFYLFIIHYQTHLLQRLADHISGSRGKFFLFCYNFVQIVSILFSNCPHFLDILFRILSFLLRCSEICNYIYAPFVQFDHKGILFHFLMRNYSEYLRVRGLNLHFKNRYLCIKNN